MRPTARPWTMLAAMVHGRKQPPLSWPQFTLSTFGLVWFTVDFGWSALAAGALISVSQFAGAAGRIAVGVWSDRAASRLRPLRLVAMACVVVLLIAAACGAADWAIAAAVGPVMGALIGVVGIPAALALTAFAPVIAVPIVPSASAERIPH